MKNNKINKNNKNNKNILKNYDFKIFALIIISFFIILGLTNKINQDYTNYENIHYNQDTFNIIKPDIKTDIKYYFVQTFKTKRYEYTIGISFLLFTSIVLLFTLIDRYNNYNKFKYMELKE